MLNKFNKREEGTEEEREREGYYQRSSEKSEKRIIKLHYIRDVTNNVEKWRKNIKSVTTLLAERSANMEHKMNKRLEQTEMQITEEVKQTRKKMKILENKVEITTMEMNEDLDVTSSEARGT